LDQVTCAEDWLYDKFEDGMKVEFADKLVELQAAMSVVKNRFDAEELKKEEAFKAAQETPATQEADVPMDESATESKIDDVD
jgi:hypothetical protein